MSLSLVTKTEFETVECCTCGILFALTDYYAKERRRDHAFWYCPNGHPQHWSGKSDIEKAREAADKAKLEAMEERQKRIDAENTLKRERKRVKNGVCPCCNRTFVKLGQHMKTKHPDFAKSQ